MDVTIITEDQWAAIVGMLWRKGWATCVIVSHTGRPCAVYHPALEEPILQQVLQP